MLITPKALYSRLSRVYIKAGLAGAAGAREWAIRNGLDAALPPERREDLPKREPWRTKTTDQNATDLTRNREKSEHFVLLFRIVPMRAART